jgi:hypothetical protein
MLLVAFLSVCLALPEAPQQSVSYQQFYNAWKKLQSDPNENHQVDPIEDAKHQQEFKLMQSKSSFTVSKHMYDPAAYDNAAPPGEF